jgi:hypothetical protein
MPHGLCIADVAAKGCKPRRMRFAAARLIKAAFAAMVLGMPLFVSAPAKAEAAEPIRAVVELFTSQGCNSCPPADALFNDMAEDPSLLTLSWHVQYWDMLGWRDTLGIKAAELRQRGYARSFKSRSVYTPQAVINGVQHVIGSHQHELESAIGGAPFVAVPLSLSAKGGQLRIALQQSAFEGNANVEIVTYAPESKVEILRGENTGRTITYRNSVTGVSIAGQWDGKPGTLVAAWPDKAGNGVAVLVRAIDAAGRPGIIVAAARLSPDEVNRMRQTN